MKKTVTFMTVLTLMMSMMLIPANASTVTRSIPSVRVTVATGNIDFGTVDDESALSFVSVPL